MSISFEPISSISLSLGDTHRTVFMLPFSELAIAVLSELLAGGKRCRDRHPRVDLFG